MIPWLDDHTLDFPPTSAALGPDSEAPGLLAAGGDLSPARLRAAYARGVFPWYGQGQPILWWSMDPRMVLQTRHFKLSRSLRKTIARFRATPGCEIRIDTAIAEVLKACASTPREGQRGTWILPEMQAAYLRLARAGHLHTVETWMDGELVGGLYGVNLGRMFFGESMFMRRTDASKIALAALVCLCREHQIPWIDCQQNTQHLASLGAFELPRPQFEAHLRGHIPRSAPSDWTYHPQLWSHLDVVPADGDDIASPADAPLDATFLTPKPQP
ncbi:leucyl/phenylalanyl-tRNA--protein transferase [Paucibacter sp. APW11]|uniref:Leucyl/phenylalanyl-tRNA--protein transferase n=1 Tax=Roseateles aquae TaxID=3077235 RepID=A0ABU3P806_9BURK|nr:leucyl/phenylalanyl-tRNA--protein transferase [Paucibacter sp. APW11]MDT8998228.1 leucyl/phenylalanyl-tRNA--protein transferase [Paucibacter sp. APW11]